MERDENLRCEVCGNEVKQPVHHVMGTESMAFAQATVFCDGGGTHPIQEMAMKPNHPRHGHGDKTTPGG